MGLVTNPPDFADATSLAAASLNTWKNSLMTEFNGNIDNANIKSAAAIARTKVADTALVAGNTISAGTQTCSRPTAFVGGLTTSEGSGLTSATIGGTIFVSTTAVGNVGGGTDTLITYDLAASTLTITGRGVHIVAMGYTANNANAKTVTLNWGSEVLATFALTASIVDVWEIEAWVIRTGANTQHGPCRGSHVSTNTSIYGAALSGTQTETAAITIKCTGAATSNDDILQTYLLVEAF